MIARKILEDACISFNTAQAEAVEKAILDFAVKDIQDLRERMMHLIGLRLIDAMMDPSASASHMNAAMKWIEQTREKDQPEEPNPMLAAIRNAQKAMSAGGKLPTLDEYAGDDAT